MAQGESSGAFAAWTAAADAVRATRKKTEKLAILAAYLAALSDADLALACRFLAGAPFARTDER
ncbi:MAG: hypothetical protein FJ034_07815, partial [Chloroflexi bacterium]|nr:hypothetical protein [Chloroflexota bacterium]